VITFEPMATPDCVNPIGGSVVIATLVSGPRTELMPRITSLVEIRPICTIPSDA
jgi:hypothetical protein